MNPTIQGFVVQPSPQEEKLLDRQVRSPMGLGAEYVGEGEVKSRRFH